MIGRGESVATGLEREVETYEAHRAELLGRAKDKFVLIKGDKVVDVFESVQDALKRGYDTFGNTPFLVKKIVEVEMPLNFTSFQLGV
jgi:hypothetical protein